MRAGKLVKRIGIAAICLLLVAAGTLYLIADHVPDYYRPSSDLAPAERLDAAKAFYTKMLGDFNTGCHGGKPFTWSVTERELNNWLASLDEINWLRVDGRDDPRQPGEVDRVMESAGLAGPAVAIRDGVLTLMVRSRRYDKILSVDVAFEFVSQGRMRVRVIGKRIGALPIPEFVVRDRLTGLRKLLRERLKMSNDSVGESAVGSPLPMGVSSDAVAEALGTVIAAIDAEPINTETVWPVFGDKPIRIEDIRLEDGRLTVHVVPASETCPEPAERMAGEQANR